MKLTSKGRYAVTAILDIALHAGTNPVCLADISERQNISLSYLEQLFAKLRRGGLVKSVRGPGGGYRLALPTDQISLSAQAGEQYKFKQNEGWGTTDSEYGGWPR